MKNLLVIFLQLLSIAIGVGVAVLLADHTDLSAVVVTTITVIIIFVCWIIVSNTVGLSNEEVIEKELEKAIQKHEKEIVDCPLSMGKYKNDLMIGQLSSDLEINEINIIMSNQERYRNESRKYGDECDNLMMNGGNINVARGKARLSVMTAETALEKVSDRLMNSCLNKVKIIGEVSNDVRVADLEYRIKYITETREMWRRNT